MNITKDINGLKFFILLLIYIQEKIQYNGMLIEN